MGTVRTTTAMVAAQVAGEGRDPAGGRETRCCGEGETDGLDGDRRRMHAASGKVREGETTPMTCGSHLSGRTKIMGRSNPYFNIR
jgi:hypothetical protein